MFKRRQARPVPKKPYTIAAQDGADDEGGTVYWLYDDLNRVIAGSAWPQPLEEIAHVTGHPVLRATFGGSEPDCDDS